MSSNKLESTTSTLTKEEVDKQKVELFKKLTKNIITEEEYTQQFEWLDSALTNEYNTIKMLLKEFKKEILG